MIAANVAASRRADQAQGAVHVPYPRLRPERRETGNTCGRCSTGFGLKLPRGQCGQNTAIHFNRILEKIAGHDEAPLVSEMVLRTPRHRPNIRPTTSGTSDWPCARY